MKPNCIRQLSIVLLLSAQISSPALAERTDREKPVHLEADRITVDDVNKSQVFEGNVQLIQGTLVIRTARLVVNQDADGFQKGIAYGGADGLAHFRQKREAKDVYVDGEAERIEYDARTEKVEFYVRAHLTSGGDEVRGPFISYNARTENYLVSGAEGKPASRGERVRAVIQPRNNGGAETPAGSDGPALKPATGIAPGGAQR